MGLDDRKYMDPKEYKRLISKKPKVKPEQTIKEQKEDVQDKEIKSNVKKPWWKV